MRMSSLFLVFVITSSMFFPSIRFMIVIIVVMSSTFLIFGFECLLPKKPFLTDDYEVWYECLPVIQLRNFNIPIQLIPQAFGIKIT